MLNFEALREHKVLLATDDTFVATYLSTGLRFLDVNVAGPFKSISALLQAAEDLNGPMLACVSVNMPGVDLSLEQQLKERAVPYLLFGLPMTGAAWSTAVTLWPFSAFQIAQDLLAIPAMPSRPRGE